VGFVDEGSLIGNEGHIFSFSKGQILSVRSALLQYRHRFFGDYLPLPLPGKKKESRRKSKRKTGLLYGISMMVYYHFFAYPRFSDKKNYHEAYFGA